MDINKIIEKKQNQKELEKQEIEFFVKGYTNNEITDKQAEGIIRAIYKNGMTEEEIKNLTLAMAYSGEVLDLSKISNNVIDKHSTGGVGDKITLILMPIIASLGIPVAKMSGRGLGITGGTVDKLESIPGYKTDIEIERFIENVKKIGISLIGQTLKLAPADKKIYALRDEIDCVESMPLIASSIMSKKIAAGANKIVLEVTCGSGAFMRTREDAEELSKIMMKIGELCGKEIVCIITNMEEPIGYTIGNNLEVIETINVLKNKTMPEDIKEIITTIGAYIIKLHGMGNNIEENKKKILENVENKKAYEKFVELVENQNGDISYIKNTEKFKKSKYVIPVISEKEGYVLKADARLIGECSVDLGAGRIKKEDNIQEEVGIILNKKIGDRVKIGEKLVDIYVNEEEKIEKAVEQIKKAYIITQNKVEKPKNILSILK